MMHSTKTRRPRRPVPLPSGLARVFAEYARVSVAAGIPGAEDWRAARKRDGSIWLAITTPDGTELLVSRIAGSTTEALYALTADIERLAG